ncbi:MAG: DNA cytosine methyltransferase [Bacteroidales bacterium]|nr:DNA cytosine methyltransferase [Bacteroidales bacterium]
MIDSSIIHLTDQLNEKDKVNYLLNFLVNSESVNSYFTEWKRNNRSINLATTFSGIGAPEYALKRLKIPYNIVFAGDIDSYCKEAYVANYNIAEDNWHNDVREFNATPYLNRIDLIVGGSPCQSFSHGGKRKGFEESRGTLFYEFARLIKECKPKVFIYENVTGLMTHDKGHTWEVVSNTFNELDYQWTSWVLNSKNFGIPQNRTRVYIIGYRQDLGQSFKILEKPNSYPLLFQVEDILQSQIANKYYLPIKGFLRVIDPKHKRHVALNGKIGRTQNANQQFNWYGDMRIESTIPERIENDPRIYKDFFNGVRCVARCLTPRECLRLMGFDDNFKIVVDDHQTYKQSGNSIVVNVLMEIIKKIIKTGVFNVES